ncbi:MAG: GNAT family N-acetyltransferase [Patescibacteria group bacterium]
MNTNIREATPDDIDKLIKLDKVSSGDGLRKYSLDKSAKLFDIREYTGTGGSLWVAEIESKIVGVVGVRFLGDGQAKIKALRVHPDFRNKGIATKLIGALEKYCKEKSITKIIMGVDEKSCDALNLYKSLGYKEYDRKGFGDVAAIYFSKEMQ